MEQGLEIPVKAHPLPEACADEGKAFVLAKLDGNGGLSEPESGRRKAGERVNPTAKPDVHPRIDHGTSDVLQATIRPAHGVFCIGARGRALVWLIPEFCCKRRRRSTPTRGDWPSCFIARQHEIVAMPLKTPAHLQQLKTVRMDDRYLPR